MPRILIAECRQEVSTFNPVRSRYDDFRVARGADVLADRGGSQEELDGALGVFTAAGVEVVPAYAATANTSGGVLEAAGFERIRREFGQALETAGPMDGAYLALHGAMQAENEDDPEGRLLADTRQLLGEAVPVVVSLDLHGILTERMLHLADAVVPYHTYPHVDFFETGARAARLLLRCLEGARPVTVRVRIPALVRGDELITATGAVGDCIRRAQHLEATGAALAASVMWGNPFTDVPELGSCSLVTTDGDAAAAQRLALDLARCFWAVHEAMQVPLTPLPEAIRLAAEMSEGTVVVMDAADAPSSGASGDSLAVVAEALRQGYPGTVLAPLVDAPAVAQAMAAGVGASRRLPLGGSLDRARFTPLELAVRVRVLADGRFRSESFGRGWEAGPTAVLQAGAVTLVVSTRPVSLYDRSFFRAHGQDPRRFDLVVVKSPHCEPHMYADWCARQIDVDAPGATSANLADLGHRRCRRPIFPLDADVPFEPAAEVFRRAGGDGPRARTTKEGHQGATPEGEDGA